MTIGTPATWCLTGTGNGTLTVERLVLANGATFNAGPGTMYMQDSTSVTVAGGGSATPTRSGGTLYANYNTAGRRAVLTIGAGVTVSGYGSISHYYSGSVVNTARTVLAVGAGQTLTINPGAVPTTGRWVRRRGR